MKGYFKQQNIVFIYKKVIKKESRSLKGALFRPCVGFGGTTKTKKSMI